MADFALELLKFTPPKESNIMSPLSLVAALSVLERAAGGSTKSQIANALRRSEIFAGPWKWLKRVAPFAAPILFLKLLMLMCPS